MARERMRKKDRDAKLDFKIPEIENAEVPIQDLIPDARNSRKHSERQIKLLVKSIQENGFTDPLLVWKGNKIIAGHARVIAAERAGMKSVPVRRCDHLTDTQRRALVIAHNKLAMVDFEWDEDILEEELEALKDEGVDLNSLGFSDDELPDFDDDLNPGLGEEDDAPPLPTKAKSKVGDIYILGDHRLMCGDATDKSHVISLMNGASADLVFTDPPYNVAYEAGGPNGKNKFGGQIKNDSMDEDKFYAFVEKAFSNLKHAMKPLAIIYVCHPDAQSAPKLAFEKAFGKIFRKSATIIWAKNAAGMGFQDYRSQHEPILYGWKEGKGAHFYCGDRTKTTLWDFSRDKVTEYVHPTQKPVALVEEAIRNSTKAAGDKVLDLFGGSGSTLIAAEKTKRKAYIMELDPKYVDVIVKRYEQFSGKKATKQKAKS